MSIAFKMAQGYSNPNEFKMSVNCMLYPAAIECGTEHTSFGVIFPDVKGCFAAGESFEEAFLNAKFALERHFELLAQSGEIPPLASPMDKYIVDPEFKGFLWAIVDLDIEPYLGGAVKKNVTLPKLLLSQIDRTVKRSPDYRDRSHFLQVAALRELERFEAEKHMSKI
ncbi:type II toxin-antitoxin system HicB family antitoxin [Vibrio cholerae]